MARKSTGGFVGVGGGDRLHCMEDESSGVGGGEELHNIVKESGVGGGVGILMADVSSLARLAEVGAESW